MGKNVIDASHCPDVNMDIAMFHLNASVTKDGMVYSVQTVSSNKPHFSILSYNLIFYFFLQLFVVKIVIQLVDIVKYQMSVAVD